MVDLRPVNNKLILRSIRLIRELTGCTEEEARDSFDSSNKNPKTAIVMVLLKKNRNDAEKLLKEAGGHINLLVSQGF
jgi:N-acetylmuramic acid 6-phosphate etherase